MRNTSEQKHVRDQDLELQLGNWNVGASNLSSWFCPVCGGDGAGGAAHEWGETTKLWGEATHNSAEGLHQRFIWTDWASFRFPIFQNLTIPIHTDWTVSRTKCGKGLNPLFEFISTKKGRLQAPKDEQY